MQTSQCARACKMYSQQDINLANGNQRERERVGGREGEGERERGRSSKIEGERGREGDSRINKPVVNYVFSSRDDSSLSLPAHASFHIQ